jgi:phosphoglucomutase
VAHHAATAVEPPIRFGTSGWRGILGEDVRLDSLRALVRATSTWIRGQSSERRVLVGYDTRFASRRMAEISVRILQERGLEPLLASCVIPSPVLTHSIKRRKAAAGLMLTASHNPPEYHGLKVFDAFGGCIVDADARRIEILVADEDRGAAPALALPRTVDLAVGYRRRLLQLLDVDRLAASRLRVAYDAMHGAGSGVLDAVLTAAGVKVEVIRGEADPNFGGHAPDPVPERLRILIRRMKAARGPRLGLATDGDADRFGVVLPGGRVLTETEVIALLVDHLARTGRVRRGVVVSEGTGSLVEHVASHHGLAITRRPVGFKHLSQAFREGIADVAGEESGGFALAEMGHDKDGILAGCLLAEMACESRPTVAARLQDFEDRFGRSACGRRAIAWTQDLSHRLAALQASPPERVGSARIRQISHEGGLRLDLDDGFVMLRRSGTEPVLRVYAEAGGPRRLRRRLSDALGLLEGLPAADKS